MYPDLTTLVEWTRTTFFYSHAYGVVTYMEDNDWILPLTMQVPLQLWAHALNTGTRHVTQSPESCTLLQRTVSVHLTILFPSATTFLFAILHFTGFLYHGAMVRLLIHSADLTFTYADCKNLKPVPWSSIIYGRFLMVIIDMKVVVCLTTLFLLNYAYLMLINSG